MDPTLHQILTALVDAHRSIDVYRQDVARLQERVAELERELDREAVR